MGIVFGFEVEHKRKKRVMQIPTHPITFSRS